MLSTGAVAFGIISLLPVELILQVGKGAGFAMVFALLTAAIIWNLGTWWFGLPSSSSHTLIGSIIGVGIANQLMQARTATSGVDWGQAANVGKSLLLSPIVGFALAASLLTLSKVFIKDKRLYEAPKGTEPPPFWIRGLLILTCTGVSFAHGSNDGQKGMGLIMLILIGTVPTAYALNHAFTAQQSVDFVAVSQQASRALDPYVSPDAVVADPRDEVADYVRTKNFTPNTMLGLRELINDISNEVVLYHELANIPSDRVRNFRNDMYLVSEALRLMKKSGKPQFTRAGLDGPYQLQEVHRQCHQVHSHMGEGCGRLGTGHGNHGGLEANRDHGGRKDRQGPPYLRSGSGGGNHCHGDHRRCRLLRTAREYHARVVVRSCGHHGRKSLGLAVGNPAQSADGLGAHIAGFDWLGGILVLGFQQTEQIAGSGIRRSCWSVIHAQEPRGMRAWIP